MGPPFDPEPNRLFRNDNGIFASVTTGNIVTDEHPSVTNTWGDYDNDGDIDCIVTTDSTYALNLYSNNGDGTFTKILSGDLPNTVLHQCCATVGDYDDDGDLDIFVTGGQDNRALFRNDLANGNGWIKLRLVGTASNRNGIGTKIRARATINGQPVWQRRDLSAANTFFGHNSLNIHFGFGDALVIDSLRLEWPSGAIDLFTNVPLNGFYTAQEGVGLEPLTSIEDVGSGSLIPEGFKLEQNYPNPFNPATRIGFRIPAGQGSGLVSLKIYDVSGRKVTTLLNERLPAGEHTVQFDGSGLVSGLYFYTLSYNGLRQTRKMVLMR